MPISGRPEYASDIRWIDVHNVGAGTIPSFGLMRITGVDANNVLQVDQPNLDSQDVLVNSENAIGPALDGTATRESPARAYYETSDGTPSNGQVWGAASGSYKLRSGKTGFFINGGATDSRVSVTRLFDFKPPWFNLPKSLTVANVGDTLPTAPTTTGTMTLPSYQTAASPATADLLMRLKKIYSSSQLFVMRGNTLQFGFDAVNPSLLTSDITPLTGSGVIITCDPTVMPADLLPNMGVGSGAHTLFIGMPSTLTGGNLANNAGFRSYVWAALNYNASTGGGEFVISSDSIDNGSGSAAMAYAIATTGGVIRGATGVDFVGNVFFGGIVRTVSGNTLAGLLDALGGTTGSLS